MRKTHTKTAISLAVIVALSNTALAQEESNQAEQEQIVERILVTGAPAGIEEQEASVSVSTIDPLDIAKLAPRSTAEVFRGLPGIRAESSGGGGNMLY